MCAGQQLRFTEFQEYRGLANAAIKGNQNGGEGAHGRKGVLEIPLKPMRLPAGMASKA